VVGVIRTSDIPYFEDNIPLPYLTEVECYGWYDVFTPLERETVTRWPRIRRRVIRYLPRSNYIHKRCLPGSLEEIVGKTVKARVKACVVLTCKPTTAISAALVKNRLQCVRLGLDDTLSHSTRLTLLSIERWRRRKVP
jgi:hypothetical protein